MLPKALHDDLEVIIKIVNYVKASALNTRLFRQLCSEMDANHEALLFHTEVRWLSKGNMLERVSELNREIEVFLEVQGKLDLLATFCTPEFKLALAYLTDIFEVLNTLNRKLQGRETNVITNIDHINAFIAKVQLWHRKLEQNNIASFHRLSKVLGEQNVSAGLRESIAVHLQSLADEFSRYFPDRNTDDVQMAMIRNPFNCEVDDISEDLQDEFLELVHDSAAKDDFRTLSLPNFWAKMSAVFPTVSEQALQIIVPFASTYLCEAGFSSLLVIKTKARNKLEVESDLRCSLSNTTPNIGDLVSTKQAHPSH
jgi:hypothetical protein